ncbi:transposase [uncultured Sporomusa sp.]|uniref:Transposase n=1 Tax=uncultured Sporomusa sp. TaxID=307249 RepID=A0A212LZ99_9FIRM|nr:IS110 family transposase [uncultured Sporomusa sp.]SCM82704.1 transposase [uncultured Sporomusa sp.]SCM82851.1 transposase [uncultured Sporomusa sp.]
MKKADLLSTLFVGIDVSSRENVVCALDYESQKLLRFSVPNNQPGAVEMAKKFHALLYGNRELNKLIVALESTSFYGIHIANYLSSCELLMPFSPHVYCLNPKMIANYKRSFIDLGKNDDIDAFVIADFARVGRIQSSPWRGSQFLALQRLTRHRLHIADFLTREKTYMLSNIFLKFSELSILHEDKQPFSNKYGATASSVLTDFLSTEDIANMPMEVLVDHICHKGKNRFVDPKHTVSLLQQAARNSYRLDKCLYEPLTISIASSFNLISAYEAEMKAINKAIAKTLLGLDPNAYQSLLSIPGVGPVYTAGILAEIGSIDAFKSQDALAKYAGLVWRENQSGNFKADDTILSKAGNSYLRYYLIEAASHVKNHIPEYAAFYQKKYDEVKTHQHKRALALTARKFIRLIFGLLANHQLYSSSRVSQS